jgi:hypothetical protein
VSKPKSICKFCKQPFLDFAELKFHCEMDHPADYVAVERWIGKSVVPRLESFEKLAAEQMIGAKETHE